MPTSSRRIFFRGATSSISICEIKTETLQIEKNHFVAKISIKVGFDILSEEKFYNDRDRKESEDFRFLNFIYSFSILECITIVEHLKS